MLAGLIGPNDMKGLVASVRQTQCMDDGPRDIVATDPATPARRSSKSAFFNLHRVASAMTRARIMANKSICRSKPMKVARPGLRNATPS